VHLVDFTIEIYHDARSHERQITFQLSLHYQIFFIVTEEYDTLFSVTLLSDSYLERYFTRRGI